MSYTFFRFNEKEITRICFALDFQCANLLYGIKDSCEKNFLPTSDHFVSVFLHFYTTQKLLREYVKIYKGTDPLDAWELTIESQKYLKDFIKTLKNMNSKKETHANVKKAISKFIKLVSKHRKLRNFKERKQLTIN